MPIVLRNPDWSESINTVRISLEMKGVKTTNISWIQTNLYLKVRSINSLQFIYSRNHSI